jgi:rhodanese-like protein
MFALLMGLKTISPKELHRLIQDQRASVIDVNSRQSWTQARVPGARNLDPAATATAIFHHRRTPRWCSIAPILCAGRRPTRLGAPRAWDTATCA